VAALGDLSQVISELLFLDNEEVMFVRPNQPKVPKPLHKHADPGPSGADHLRQFFRRNLQFDAYAPRIFLAEFARQSQQRLAQSLFAVNRRQVGDDLLLVSDPRRQVLHEARKQRVTA
jgi:hypothetical protein